MSSCKFPEHHSGGSGGGSAAAAGVLVVVAGVLIATHLAAVIIALAVAAGLAVAAIFVRAALHSRDRTPYDAAWSGQEDTAAAHAPQQLLQARVDYLERRLAGQIEAPAQHIHLHGIDPAEVAGIIASRQRLADDDEHPKVTGRRAIPARPEPAQSRDSDPWSRQ